MYQKRIYLYKQKYKYKVYIVLYSCFSLSLSKVYAILLHNFFVINGIENMV